MCAEDFLLLGKTHAVFKLELSKAAALLDYTCRFRNPSGEVVCSILYKSLPLSVLSMEPFSIFSIGVSIGDSTSRLQMQTWKFHFIYSGRKPQCYG